MDSKRSKAAGKSMRDFIDPDVRFEIQLRAIPTTNTFDLEKENENNNAYDH